MSKGELWIGPLFIVGASRSGTAMMRSILNGHTKIQLAGETHYFDDLRCRKGLIDKGVLSGSDADLVADFFRALDDRPYGMKGDPSRSPLSRCALIKRARDLGGGADSFFEAYCRDVAARDGKQIWGEKTPRHVFRLREILTEYPSARAICMVRDPRAVIASYRDWRNQGGLNVESDEDYARAIRAEEHRARLSYNILIAALLWRAALNSAVRNANEFSRERVKIVRYEDVVGNPPVAVRGICAWLGLGFEEAMMHIPLHNSSFDAYTQSGGVSAVPVGRWRTTLSPREIGLIQQITGRLLTHAGYERADVSASRLDLLGESSKLPIAILRAILANQSRMGNVFAYTWRRVCAAIWR